MIRFSRVSLLLVALLLVGCEKVSSLLGGGPEATLAAYLDATIHGEWQVAYGYLSSEDQAVRTLAQFKSRPDSELARALASRTTYSVATIEQSGDTARAEVDLIVPDLRGAFADIVGGAFASALSGGGQDEIEAKLAEKYGDGELPTTTKREEFTLVREPEGWRVFLDWETSDRVATLLTEARQLKDEKKLEAALERYDQVLELESELVEAREARAETRKELDVLEEKQGYMENVTLYDLSARYYETYLDVRVPGVTFKLKNAGDRILEKVEVTVYFKAADGSVIAEENFHPVLVTKYGFGDNKPLKPNYIWQMERGKFYKADSVPTEWREGAASARITNIEFASR